MHRCLQSPDIFAHIVQFALARNPYKDPFVGDSYTDINQTVAALARTCKTFSEPALDGLWHSLLTIGPLLRTFPEDVWQETVATIDRDGNPMTWDIDFLRTPVASEWARFNFYARRVKRLGFFKVEHADSEWDNWKEATMFNACIHSLSKPPSIFFDVLCLARRNTWLLPNLEEIRLLRLEFFHLAVLLPLFLGPKLKSVSFADYASIRPIDKYIPPVETITSQVNAVNHLCPSVAHIEVHVTEPNVALDAAVRFAYARPGLEGFVVTSPEPWPNDFLQYLANLPYLKKVYLNLGPDTTSDMQLFDQATLHHPFPSLQSLHIHLPSVMACTQLIQIMHFSRLRSLIVDTRETATASQLKALFTTLEAHCAHTTLLTLNVSFQVPDGGDIPDDDSTFTIHHLRPLFCFHNMRDFRIATPLLYAINNDGLREMADAWPLAIVLAVGQQWGGIVRPTITWAAVAYLLSKCRQVTGLQLPGLDSTVDDVSKVTSLPSFRPNDRLRGFKPYGCLFGGEDHFAESLFAIAPLVGSIHGSCYDPLEVTTNIPVESAAFFGRVESLLWELRRTRMRAEFGFLDKYLQTEADRMNEWGPPKPPFPYYRLPNGRAGVYEGDVRKEKLY